MQNVGKRSLLESEILFYNSVFRNMTVGEVKMNILNFIKKDPTAYYEIIVGTDSQVRRKTTFVTGIVVRRIGDDGIGKGAWACLTKQIANRPIDSLREKISMETSYSQQVLYYLDNDFHDAITDILIPHMDKNTNAGYDIKVHIDIGENGPTRELIAEMVGRIKSMGVEAEIKPDSYVASGYANRYTK